MLSRLIRTAFNRFGLTKFDQEVVNEVMPTAPQLNHPQVIDTLTREQYRESNKIKNKRIPPQDLSNNWTRSFHNRLYT